MIKSRTIFETIASAGLSYPVRNLLFPASLALSSHVSAGIDSGGGTSSAGTLSNRSSIGGSFATVQKEADETTNHPGIVDVIYPITPSSVTDINENQLADGWEILYFGSIGVDPSGDSDHDGTSNMLEYLAGTNPNSATSVFRPQISHAAGIFQMTIPTTIGRNYQIWVTRDLESWILQSTIPGDDSQQSFEFDETSITSGPLANASHPSSYFFRVRILIP